MVSEPTSKKKEKKNDYNAATAHEPELLADYVY
jgi:hypothetical protein